ncbi:MAG: LysM peptidoglycan-binding domain-containing protein [bacterium]|nr:LysM peptidoglycan-binding domain-containing protein [bacterium]
MMRRAFLFVLALLMLTLAVSFPALAQQQQGQTVHVVQPGENLYRISLRYGTTIGALQAANGLPNPNFIYVGQRLVIPGGTGTPAPVPTTPPANPGNPGTPGTPSTYTVVRGDTLANIARRFSTTVPAISSLNGIANPNRIFAGQVLRIPGGTGSPAPVPTAPPGQPGQPVPTAPPSNPGPGPITTGFELGGHVQDFRYPDQMRGAGMTWVKKQIVWSRGQGADIARGAIDQARANGFKILLGIVGNVNELGANRTQYIQEFANFLSGVAALGPDGIEVWNEPNIDRQWPAGQISGAAYTEMLRASYQAIKSVNGNILVISGAPAPTGAESAFPGRVVNDDNFIRQMSQAGAGSFMDCVGLHYNEGILPPTATSGDPRGNSGYYTRYYPAMVSLYSGVFPGKPLCFTEIGYLTPEGYPPLPAAFAWAQNVTVQNQAEWLASAATLSRRGGRVRMMIIWNVDFTNYGDDPMAGYAIIRPDGQCRACITLGAAMR